MTSPHTREPSETRPTPTSQASAPRGRSPRNPWRSPTIAAALLAASLLWRPATAQDEPPPDPPPDPTAAPDPALAAALARESYQRCVDLKSLRRYCKASEACDEGLEIYPSNPALRSLASELRSKCEAEDKRPTCDFGLVATPRTQWHCCWPGQSWDEKCHGMPSHCTEHFVLNERTQSCEPKPCEPGMYHVDGVHCCWPGQRWSRSREHCIYSPRCPEGFEPFDNTCRLAGACPSGMTRVDKVHCCWPGQSWSQTSRQCNGTPKCPPGLTPWKGQCEPDSDADAIPNDTDSCPQTPAPNTPNGCPSPDEPPP